MKTYVVHHYDSSPTISTVNGVAEVTEVGTLVMFLGEDGAPKLAVSSTSLYHFFEHQRTTMADVVPIQK